MRDLAVAAADSERATHFRRLRAVLMAGAPLAAAGHITAAADIMAAALDSGSAFTRPTDTDMPLRSAIPPDSTMPMACGNTIPVAPCRTDIKLGSDYPACLTFRGNIIDAGRRLTSG